MDNTLYTRYILVHAANVSYIQYTCSRSQDNILFIYILIWITLQLNKITTPCSYKKYICSVTFPPKRLTLFRFPLICFNYNSLIFTFFFNLVILKHTYTYTIGYGYK